MDYRLSSHSFRGSHLEFLPDFCLEPNINHLLRPGPLDKKHIFELHTNTNNLRILARFTERICGFQKN